MRAWASQRPARSRPRTRPADPLRFWGNLVAFGAAALGWSVLAGLLRPVLPRARGEVLGRHAISLGFRLFLGLMRRSGTLVCDLSALDAIAGEGRLLIAANHPSLLDAVLLVSRLPRAVCLMKAPVLANPCLGGGARLAGYVRNDGTALGVVRAGAGALAAGHQLVIFPEGTRTGTPPLGPLRGGFALMARLAGAPIQAVLIESDSPYLHKGWPVWRRPPLPIVVRVRLGRRFEPPFAAQAVSEALARHYREALAG